MRIETSKEVNAAKAGISMSLKPLVRMRLLITHLTTRLISVNDQIPLNKDKEALQAF